MMSFTGRTNCEAHDPQDIIRAQNMSNLQFSPDHPPIILAVDTSSVRASFAIARGATIIASSQSDAFSPHSKIFFDLLSELLQNAGLLVADIDVFAAATGPGSFTGLRVGLSAIKGLSHAMGKPGIGVSSIDAIALSSKVSGKILALIEAGREEIYSGLREIDEDRIPKPIGTDTVGRLSKVIESFTQYLNKEPLTVVRLSEHGEGQNVIPSNWQIAAMASITAEEIAVYAGKILNSRTGQGLHPYYIRPSDAEIKRQS
ncbi:MAG: tRNA (adenosine(37)-N6)-threonylcarbamoyltransferase complex dimerization subunit type 1 TsaB [Acidobacteriota bacterium]